MVRGCCQESPGPTLPALNGPFLGPDLRLRQEFQQRLGLRHSFRLESELGLLQEQAPWE